MGESCGVWQSPVSSKKSSQRRDRPQCCGRDSSLDVLKLCLSLTAAQLVPGWDLWRSGWRWQWPAGADLCQHPKVTLLSLGSHFPWAGLWAAHSYHWTEREAWGKWPVWRKIGINPVLNVWLQLWGRGELVKRGRAGEGTWSCAPCRDTFSAAVAQNALQPEGSLPVPFCAWRNCTMGSPQTLAAPKTPPAPMGMAVMLLQERSVTQAGIYTNAAMQGQCLSPGIPSGSCQLLWESQTMQRQCRAAPLGSPTLSLCSWEGGSISSSTLHSLSPHKSNPWFYFPAKFPGMNWAAFVAMNLFRDIDRTAQSSVTARKPLRTLTLNKSNIFPKYWAF